MTKIVIDCLGGDNCPDACTEGSLKALKKFDDLHLILAGDEKTLSEKIKDAGELSSRIEIMHAPDVISGEEKPGESQEVAQQDDNAEDEAPEGVQEEVQVDG